MNYITLDQAIELHDALIHQFGGLGGVRDLHLLESALASPMTSVFQQEMYPTIFDKAGCYLFFIIKNHAFLDGNKRTATACCLLFLESNGIELDYDRQDLIEFVVSIAEGKADKEKISHYLRTLCQDREKSTL